MTTTSNPVVRSHDGAEAPVAGTYVIDPAHTSVEFVARHLMFTKVRGRMNAPSGTFTIAEDPSNSSIEVELDVKTISTGEAQRDAHLTSPDFLDADNYPNIRFVSTGLKHVKGSRWELEGDLTIKDVTRPVALDLEFAGAELDPWGKTKLGFSATTEIDREDWGLTYNAVLESGGVLVGKKVQIELDVQAAPQD